MRALIGCIHIVNSDQKIVCVCVCVCVCAFERDRERIVTLKCAFISFLCLFAFKYSHYSLSARFQNRIELILISMNNLKI